MSNIKFNHNFQSRQFKRQLIQQRQNKQNIVFKNFLVNAREQIKPVASVVNKTKNIVENLDLSNVELDIDMNMELDVNVNDEDNKCVVNTDVDVDVDVAVNNYNINYIKNKIMADYGGFCKK